MPADANQLSPATEARIRKGLDRHGKDTASIVSLVSITARTHPCSGTLPGKPLPQRMVLAVPHCPGVTFPLQDSRNKGKTRG